MKVNTNKNNEATSFTAYYAADNTSEVHRYDGLWDVRNTQRQPGDIGSCATREKQPCEEAGINRGANSTKARKRKRDELDSTLMLAIMLVIRSIKTLSPKEWLDDATIEYCLAKGCEDALTRESSLLEEWNFSSLANPSNFSVLKSFVVTKGEQGDVKPISDKRKEKLNWLIGGCRGLCDFLLFPINFENSHWSLAIVWQANEDEQHNKPCILYLDSFKQGISNEVKVEIEKKGEAIRKYLNSLSKKKFTQINLPLIHVEVPQQKNYYDCGMFLLHYAILFMMCDSKHALALELKEGNKKDWFSHEVPCNLRKHLKQAVVKELDSLQKWRDETEKDDGVVLSKSTDLAS